MRRSPKPARSHRSPRMPARRWLMAALLLGASACNSVPTLPLPPPVASVGQPSTQGLVLVEGHVNPRAFVSVFNERTEGGVITRADLEGYFAAELEGQTGDVLSVWQETDGNAGERTEIVVPAPR